MGVVCCAVNRRMDEWVRLENLDLNTVDVADIEGPDGKGCALHPYHLFIPPIPGCTGPRIMACAA